MKIRHLLVASTILLCGCASITAIPLQAGTKNGAKDGAKKICDDTAYGGGCVDGIRYYLPKPYLLITQLPDTPKTTTSNNGSNNGGNGNPGRHRGGNAGNNNGNAGNSGNSGNKDNGANKSDDAPTSSAPSSSAADTSFSASTATYSVKLIYLPDFSKPMALQAQSGLFGTTNVNPTLLDGWMLTNMTGSVDSGGSNVLSAVASIVKGGSGAGGGKGDGQAGSGNPDTHQQTAANPAATKLRNDINNNKDMKDDDKSTLLNDLQKLLASTAQSNGSTWGSGVLQPGLYEFDFSANDGGFNGLTAVTLFCDHTVKAKAKAKASDTCTTAPGN